MWQAAAAAASLAALVAIPSAAQASAITPSSKRVTSGFTAVSPCGALSASSVSWNVTAGVVNNVTLTAIPAACVGGTLSLTLGGAGGTALGTVSPVVVAATTQTFSFSSGTPTASAVTTTTISLVGP